MTSTATLQPIRLYSKTSVGTDWSCQRKFFYNYEYAGKGLNGENTTLELFQGTLMHDSFAVIAMQQAEEGQVDIETIASLASKQMKQAITQAIEGQQADPAAPDAQTYIMEQASLIEGMIRGYHKHMWPKLLAQYPVIRMVEPHMVYRHPNSAVGMMVKPDLILANEEGANFYIEYKSTSSKKPGWIEQWETAVQIHSSIRAIEQRIGEPIEAVIVQGVYKGYKDDYGKQSSPYCYAYKQNGKPPFTKDQISYEWKNGLKRTPVWELEGGLKKWVEGMPENVLANQFPQSPPIYVNDEEISRFFAQREIREWQIANALPKMAQHPIYSPEWHEIADMAFPQKFDACTSTWGECQFKPLCFGPKAVDPLEIGFSWRSTDHLKPFYAVLEAQDAEQKLSSGS